MQKLSCAFEAGIEPCHRHTGNALNCIDLHVPAVQMCLLYKCNCKLYGCDCSMEFPPRSLNLVTTACKKGRISVWDFEEVSEHTSFEGIHKYQINSLKFIPGRDSMSLLTACCLGHTCLTDIETGMHSKLVDLNPEVPTLLLLATPPALPTIAIFMQQLSLYSLCGFLTPAVCLFCTFPAEFGWHYIACNNSVIVKIRNCVMGVACFHNSAHTFIVQGWIEGVSTEKNWVMMCSVGVHASQGNTAWCGDNRGKVRCLDLRSKDVQFSAAIHGSDKVTSLEFHPHDSNLMLSAGNDHCVKLFDVRKLKPSGADSTKRHVFGCKFCPNRLYRLSVESSCNDLAVWAAASVVAHEFEDGTPQLIG
jgi:WD40 repeat protein